MGSLPLNSSGSRAAAMLGLNDFKTRFGVWLEIMEAREPGFCKKHGYEFEPFEGNPATELGSAFEDAITHLLGTLNNDPIIYRERTFSHPDHDFITCHVDGIFMNSRALFEGKTTSEFAYKSKWGEPGTDRIPRDYQIQVQHNMGLAKLDRAIVSVLVFPKRQADLIELATFDFDTCLKWSRVLNEMGYFHQYPIEANAEVQQSIFEAEIEFWEKHVIGRTPPEPRSYADIRALVKEPKGTIVANEEIASFAAEYKALTGEIGQAKKRKEQLKTLVLKFMRNQAETPIDDDSVEKWILRDETGRQIASFDGKTYR